MAYPVTVILACVFAITDAFGQDARWTGHCITAAQVTSMDTCRRLLTVDPPLLAASGERLLLHQTIATEPHRAGRAEWCIVDTVIGNRIFMSTRFTMTHDAGQGLQIVRPLRARTGAVVDTLRVTPWNGRFGGVLVIRCDDTLVMRGIIDARGCGGRGGDRSIDTRDTSGTISSRTANRRRTYGEGARSAAAGGSRNAGGAGGANVGGGGHGGRQTSAYDSIDVGGQRTVPIAIDPNATLSMGGGGGGGHQNDRGGTSGGNGGGVVLIEAPVIIAEEGAHIVADGADAGEGVNDGAGGGGAGGSIAIVAKVVRGRLLCSASGGDGGSTIGDQWFYGPGGGGGGGHIGLDLTDPASVIIPVATHGSAGIARCGMVSRRTTFGATDGEPGSVGLAATIPTGSHGGPRLRFMIRDEMDRDEGRMVVVTGAARVRWVTPHLRSSDRGDTLFTGPLDDPTWFIAEVETADGCVFADSVLVRPETAKGPILIVSFDHARGAPGDTVDLYLRVRCEPTVSRTVSGIAYCSVRGTTLVPLRGGRLDADLRIHKEFPFRLPARSSSTYRREGFVVALGDSARVALSIDSVVLLSDTLTVRRSNGRFSLDSICRTGGRVRLVDATGPRVQISGRTIETMADELFVVDLLGRRIEPEVVTSGRLRIARVPDSVRGVIFITTVLEGHARTMSVFVGDP
jgi:hypothetical protein